MTTLISSINKLIQATFKLLGLGVVKKNRLEKLRKDEKELFELKMLINGINGEIKSLNNKKNTKESLSEFIENLYKKLNYLQTSSIFKSIFLPEYISAIKFLLQEKKDLLIFDVGAHTGQTLEYYSKHFEEASIYSFEPFKESFEILNKKSKEYPMSKVHNIGFSNQETESSFYSYIGPDEDYSQMNSLLEFENDALLEWGFKNPKDIEQVSCSFDTLDNFTKNNHINEIDLLKIDVQGAEYKVLEGGVNLLKDKKVDLILMEIIIASNYKDQWDFKSYINFFNKYNYSLYGIYNLSYGPNKNLLQFDSLFKANQEKLK